MHQTLERSLTHPTTPLEIEIANMGPWFHNLHLPDGTQTAPDHPLGDFPSKKWESIKPYIPEDLRGRSALDIGCNAGFYSLELARRGARVTAIDIDDHYLQQARWAAHLFHLSGRIEFANMQVYDLVHVEERYDIVLFMGVFYHLRHPLLALDIVAKKIREFMVFQTLTMPGTEEHQPLDDFSLSEREIMLDLSWPKMAFIEQCFEGDPTNWWAPNTTAVEAMLRSSGLSVTQRLADEIFLCEPGISDNLGMKSANESEDSSATRALQALNTP